MTTFRGLGDLTAGVAKVTITTTDLVVMDNLLSVRFPGGTITEIIDSTGDGAAPDSNTAAPCR